MSNELDEGRETGVIRSVDRAVGILDLLAREGWSTGADVARGLRVHRSTALRLLATLDRHGLVERDPRTSKYRLGRRLVQLASSVRGEVDLRQVARPVCEALARALGETVTLDVLDGAEIVPVEQASGSTSVVSVSWLGTRSPVHCTASGKVILAFTSEEQRAKALERPLERRTSRTIVERPELGAQLARARDQGYAATFEELEVGLNAVAAPVRTAGGDVIAAIDVSGPAHRIDPAARPELIRRTVEAADDLSRRLGYRAPAIEAAPQPLTGA
ncbi:MAG TPA: IclR family transcriptional regulator [Candidatus Dormibacteraeota bacterium]|nr:IclR family transcriptional regulator [Candidatus Dormibacteraeota bacterium]